MATIKSHTDISQSKTLSKILPLESADLHYHYNNDFDELESIPTITEEDDHFVLFPKDVRCWSLAELLSVIPQEIFDGEYIINITEGRTNRWMLTYDNYEIGNHSYYSLSTGADNLIDCCVEMIIKLKERNLL